MAEFIRSTEIKRTRKEHRCFACGLMIPKGSKAVEWVSTCEGTINSTYVHCECWDISQNYCFGCKICNDGDGFQERYLMDSMSNACRCEGVDKWYPFYLSMA